MSAKSVFKMRFLSMIAAIGLFGASNGFADAGHTTSNSEGVTANIGVKAQALEATEATRVVSAGVQIAKTPAPHDQVVDSEGNIYRLIPLQTQMGSPQDAKTSEVVVKCSRRHIRMGQHLKTIYKCVEKP